MKLYHSGEFEMILGTKKNDCQEVQEVKAEEL